MPREGLAMLSLQRSENHHVHCSWKEISLFTFFVNENVLHMRTTDHVSLDLD